MVNFVCMFCPELQKLLKPIYDLTKKGKPFLWEKEQWEAFKEIMKRILNPPVLSMPNRKGRFILYSDTSEVATGSRLYQHQDEKPSKMKPTTNRIKRLVEVLSSYSFNLYYVKGKDMVLSDYLSRQMGERSDLHQIISFSFNIREVSLKPCQNKTQDTFMV